MGRSATLLDLDDGRTVWTVPGVGPVASVADWSLHGDSFVLPDELGNVLELTLSGELHWKTPAGGDPYNLIARGETVYTRVVAGDSKAETVVALSADDGRVLWSRPAGGRMMSTVVPSEGTVMFTLSDADSHVNTLQVFGPDDIRLWGGQTCAPARDASQFIGCTRYLLALQNTLSDLLAPFVWDVATDRQRRAAAATVSEFFDRYYDPGRRTLSLDLGPKPKFDLRLEDLPSGEAVFVLDLRVYLTIPMTWVNIQMRLEE